MAFFARRANDPDYVSFEDQLTLYLKWSGDSEDFLGFDRRFEKWCEETPRSSLWPTEEPPQVTRVETGWLSSKTN